MLRLLHRVASHGWVYDRIQDLVGARELDRRLGRHLAARPSPHWLLDVGGGTGRIRRILSPQTRYVCLDNELPKLVQLRRTLSDGAPILGDATLMPFRTASAKLVVCMDMTHHLTDAQLAAVLGEVKRVLHPSGLFLLLDCLLSDRWIGRTLWRLDRGSHPRSATHLRDTVSGAFHIRHEEQIRLLHEYSLFVCETSSPV